MARATNDFDDGDFDTFRQLSVFKKSVVILELVEGILDGIPFINVSTKNDYHIAKYKHHSLRIMENALVIPVKIAEAHQNDVYDCKMESATLIRKAAIDILKNINGLQQTGFKEADYLRLLHDSIEDFRPVFARWVQTFNIENYIIDRWGLFNPAGVHFDDHMPHSNSTYKGKINPEEYENGWDETGEDEEMV